MVKKTALFLFLFSSILTYFVLSHSWYPHATLTIEGTAELNSTITARWDSGEGFNSYEERRFSFLPFYGSSEKRVAIVIKGGAEKHKASMGTRVILSELRVDDSGVNIPNKALRDVRHVPGQGWYLTTGRSRISLDLPVERQLSFSFKTAINAGIAAISINGYQSSHDLFRRNWEILFANIRFWLLDENGNFTLTMNLPRYLIEKLEVSGTGETSISTAAITTGTSSINPEFEQTSPGTILLHEPNRSLERLFHPTHFFYQLLSALLVTLILWKVFTHFGSVESVDELFIGEHRWLLRLFLVGGIAVYGTWLLAFWPGVMSVDSLNIWRAAQLPEVMIYNHPFLNELWYFFLSLFWRNTAIVPVVQIVLLTTLIGVTFFAAVKRGVSCWLVVPCYLLLLFSVPVGLYTATLWKDIPFALLVILWALIPVYLYDKKRAGKKVRFSPVGGGLLLLSFFCLLMFRHNGLIYLFVIPSLFLLLGLVRLSRAVTIAGCVAGAGLIYLVLYPPITMKSGSYFHDLSRTYLTQIEAESFSQRAIDAATNYPRLLDIKRYQYFPRP